MSTITIENTILPVNYDAAVRPDLTTSHIKAAAPPPSPVRDSARCTTSVGGIESEIRALAKTCGTRVATKFRTDREKIVGFLTLIAQIALSEHAALPGDKTDGVTHEPCTFVRTVEEFSAQSGCSSHEVDKFLRWADKGLHLLHCPIPKDKTIRRRQVTIKVRDVRDLKLLFDPGKRVGYWDLPVEVHANGFKYKSLSNFCLNFAIGCSFGCLFCYVPSASTINLGWRLIRYGVLDADYDWGTYTLIRKWDCTALFFFGPSLRAGDAPTVNPSSDQADPVDLSGSGSTLDFTATGGTCDQPDYPPDGGGSGNGDCTWVTDGDKYYVWEYTDDEDDPQNGLSATPGSDDEPDEDGDDQSTLSIDESHAGYSSITVWAVQKWRASDGSDSTVSTRSFSRTYGIGGPHTNDDPTPGANPKTPSPTATPIQVAVQKPKSAKSSGETTTLDSQFANAGYAGKKFTLTIMDRDHPDDSKAQPVKNITDWVMFETVKGKSVKVSAPGFDPFVSAEPNIDNRPLDTPAANIQADGTFSDNVGATFAGYGEQLCLQIMACTMFQLEQRQH